MDIPTWLYVWTAVIALFKFINIISGYVVQKKYVTVHTAMNKVTGALLYMLPFTLTIVPLVYTGIPICITATFAAVQEGHFMRGGKERRNISGFCILLDFFTEFLYIII